MKVEVYQAGVEDEAVVAQMVGALLREIMDVTGVRHFDVDVEEMTARCGEYLQNGIYAAFVLGLDDEPSGVLTLCESHALYAGGAFGIVQECYVKPEARSRGCGRLLLEAAEKHARRSGWTRLELTTPRLPEFARSITFYEGIGFEVTGGRKMRKLIAADPEFTVNSVPDSGQESP